jgi:hypothetical protein
LLSASAAGGVFAADFVRGDGGAPAEAKADGAHKDDAHSDKGHGDKGHGDKGHGDDAKGKKAKPSSKGHGSKDDYAESGDTEYVKFKRQFVVPVVKNQSVDALILINLGLEVPAKRQDDVFRMEPRFRDAFIRELLQLSDRGYFDEELTSPATYEVLRETLARAAKEIDKEGVKDVLILDLTRQDR